MKLEEISKITNAELIGDANYDIKSIATLPKEAKDEEIAFVFPHRFSKAKKYLKLN